ncbi:polynucleotide adenylyltransferase PcnB [Aeromonas cavernicola]|uniref:Poly(A) polymerase I n=1 Tax=Aeromonas cavernicola TaxID=1006623 RepID=A0A2H9U7H7_9GAMM|nr:polynucleotide adenylyltransferase PcnB [Aeromonas cavernicola]PJG59985.1 polynucleotide adenylyltransferase [Aeromonas cavernicola]
MKRCTILSHIANFCRKMLGKEDGEQPVESPNHPHVAESHRTLSRDQHAISRKEISENALKVLYRLNKGGYDAYLVGGGVRDLLLGRRPKDFDIATNATPEQIKALFSNCRLIGRRFRLAHIVFGRDVIEVATFRGHHHQVNTSKHVSAQSDEGMLLRDNVYGTIEEDAERRDFTVNALYYSVKDFTLHDFEGGLDDLAERKLELIGDPETRYREDPVRMLRAVRFAAKLEMTISPRTAAPISLLAPLLQDIPPARLFEETLKLFLAGDGLATYTLLREYGLFQQLFPQVAAHFTPHGSSPYEQFIEQALIDTDRRVFEEKRVNPAFLYATLLWGCVEARGRELENESGLPWYDAFMLAINEVLDSQVRIIAVPRRFTTDVRDIWALQQRLTRRQGRHPERAMEHPKFRAAYDFLLLRNRVERGLGELASWWERYVTSHPEVRPQLQREATRRPASSERPGEARSNDGEKRSSNRRRPRRRKPKVAE